MSHGAAFRFVESQPSVLASEAASDEDWQRASSQLSLHVRSWRIVAQPSLLADDTFMIQITFTITAAGKVSHQIDAIDASTVTSTDLVSLWAHLQANDLKDAIQRKLVEVCRMKGIDPNTPFLPHTPVRL